MVVAALAYHYPVNFRVRKRVAPRSLFEGFEYVQDIVAVKKTLKFTKITPQEFVLQNGVCAMKKVTFEFD